MTNLFEYHFHGCAGHKTIELNRQAYEEMSCFLSNRGETGGFLATFSAAPVDNLVECLRFCRELMESEPLCGASLDGVYLEGPFVRQAGGMTANLLARPDMAAARRLVEAGGGIVKAVAIAPELPGAMELIEYFASEGIRVAAGHFCCSSEVLKEAIDRGLSSVTHFCNNGEGDIECVYGRYSTDGPWLEVLADDRLSIEVICDGVHVDPRLVKALWRVKGPDLFIPITDGCAATGMTGPRLSFPDPAGTMQEFEIKNGALFIADTDRLTGSISTMNVIRDNLVNFCGISREEADLACSRTPRRMVDLSK
ncbi:MAG: hypothetical protein MJ025_01115 [Victivallaceae bacterium]|nr:hypothetical protein [Victivallaceae bacterium]